MGEFLVENVKWKKGELGVQQFQIFESDGITKRDGTGLDYDFKFWKRGATSLKGSGSLVAVDIVNGLWQYTLQVTDTDTAFDHYLGELIEDPASTKIRSESFKVIIEDSSDL